MRYVVLKLGDGPGRSKQFRGASLGELLLGREDQRLTT